ncbi:MAG: S-methyl-5-thioribose-1-phosphate isomerase [Thermodesulfobacteriota bacterium]
MKFNPIEWKGNYVKILDQRKLPQKVHYLLCEQASSVAKAIRTMAIRGAPVIGIAAAMGIALDAKKLRTNRSDLFRKILHETCQRMKQTRPTAINLFWAVQRMEKIIEQVSIYGVRQTQKWLEEEALRIYEEDLVTNRKMGENGKGLIKEGSGVLTHCNAGGLATTGYGTALGVIRAAWSSGKRFHVYVDETRPLLQGARLTAWELVQEKIPCTVITDNMAGALMEQRKINLVLLGADRIVRNGDIANKIGTYSLAILARWHKIPFYVVAPTSTFDLNLCCGDEIPIEERAEEEVTYFAGKRITPKGVMIYNPAFDITPHRLIDAIITEKGIIRKPFEREIKRLLAEGDDRP